MAEWCIVDVAVLCRAVPCRAVLCCAVLCRAVPCCAVLALVLHCNPIFVLSFMFGGESGYLPEAMKEANLELQSSPNVGVYLPFKHLTMNGPSFLRALNVFHYKHHYG